MSKDKSGNWFGRHKILTVIGALIVVGIIASAAGGGSKTNTSTGSNDSKQAKTENKPAMAKIGEVARDGKFEYTVASVVR